MTLSPKANYRITLALKSVLMVVRRVFGAREGHTNSPTLCISGWESIQTIIELINYQVM